jgi:hypothetical protein
MSSRKALCENFENQEVIQNILSASGNTPHVLKSVIVGEKALT